MSKDLYPLKFIPIYKTKIWGGNKFEKLFKRKEIPLHCGESWEVSGVEGDLSVVSNGFLKGNNLDELIEVYMGDLVGDSVYETFGNSFPLLVKFIDASDDLSVQVHPGDDLAWKRHNCPGKTEMWYVIHAEEGSQLVAGLNRKLSKEEYVEAVENGGLHNMLNILKVENGDVFFVPPGCVHAIGKGVLLCEVQQASDITYRIFDYNRLDDDGNPRELHTDLAADAMDFECVNNTKQEYTPKNNEPVNIIDCKYFTTNIFEFDMPEQLGKLMTDMMRTPLGYAAIGILAPVAEEMVFRGAILRKLLAVVGEKWHWLAILFSAVLFGVAHGNIAQFVHAFLMGILLGWMYYRTDSIVPGVVYHWINNAVAYVMYNLYPNPEMTLTDLFGSERTVLMAVGFSLCLFLPALFQLNLRLQK